MIYYFESMKIEDIEKACKLNKELKELYEILRLGCYIDRTLSSVLLLFHDNKRYDLNSLLTQETRTKIMNIIFEDWDKESKKICDETVKLIMMK